MATVQVRYIVKDVDAAIAFAIEVEELEAMVAKLRSAGAKFRNDVVTGVGGKQILLEDPSGNPVELFQPTVPEARLGAVQEGR
jgi:predicted enzyme related to lactoylglutathione lyase